MTRWEHLTLTAEQDTNGLQIHKVEGPKYTSASVEIDVSLGGDPVLRQLDELGHKGWELIAIESQGQKRVFWLRFAIPEGHSRRW